MRVIGVETSRHKKVGGVKKLPLQLAISGFLV